MIATAINEQYGIDLMNALQEKYPALDFSRVKSTASQTWKIYVTCKHGLYYDELEVKMYCHLISQK